MVDIKRCGSVTFYFAQFMRDQIELIFMAQVIVTSPALPLCTCVFT
jgi:hypothetical protein